MKKFGKTLNFEDFNYNFKNFLRVGRENFLNKGAGAYRVVST